MHILIIYQHMFTSSLIIEVLLSSPFEQHG